MPEGSRLARLIRRVSRESDRWAVCDLLDRIPDRERTGWVAQLDGYLDGLDLPAGMQATPEQLATACRDYACTPGNPSPMHFRAFVRRVITEPKARQPDGPAGPRRDKNYNITGQGALDAAQRWADKMRAKEANGA